MARGHPGPLNSVFRASGRETCRIVFEMPAVQQVGSCLGFYKRLLKTGAALLVYARRVKWGPSGEQGYFTDACAPTKLLKEASEDRVVLAKILSTAK